jgi:uncharacterized protein (DUF362 family)
MPVSFVHVENCALEVLKEAIKNSLNLIHFDFKMDVDKIAIKPNMCYYFHPSTGEVTDPKFIGALIDVLEENLLSEPEIFVAESDASAMKCEYAFKMVGYRKILEEKDVRLVNLAGEDHEVTDIKIGDWYLRFRIPKILRDCDLIINVPKIKYMSDTKITCALKNMYGCNAYPRKSIYHVALDEAIVGINKIIKTGLVVVDGIVVVGKSTRRLNLIMASEDPVAADAAASKLMGMNPKSVRHIALASMEGLGSLNFTSIGDFAYFQQVFPKKGFRDSVREAAASIYLRVFQEK